jgi:uncharacterized integral membrane protein (TIGR00698 family)
LILAGGLAFVASTFGTYTDLPIILSGLLLGLALSNFIRDKRFDPGLDMASKLLLRLGIVLLGLQITFAQVAGLGLLPFLCVLLVMAAALGGGLLGAHLTGQTKAAGVLAGGSTAICGASAALALFGAIGKDRLSQARFSLTLLTMALVSAGAMAGYPLLAKALDLDAAQAGFLVGASIHDVAQSIGAGFAISNEAGANATLVKLTRVAMLAPLVALVALYFNEVTRIAHRTPETPKAPGWRALLSTLSLPWFITGFVVVLVVNSVLPIPKPVSDTGLFISKAFLLVAVTANGLKTDLSKLAELGWRAVVPVLTATLASFALALLLSLTII